MLLNLYVQFVLIIDFKQRYNTQVVITRAVMKSWNPLKADTCRLLCLYAVESNRRA